jgi:hypothetical protein
MRLAAVAAMEQRLDVLNTLHYRPDLFGRAFSDATDLALRGPSDWTPGERELFAAFVSAQNQCPF